MDRCPQCINEWDGAQCNFCGYVKGNERSVTGALPSGTQVENRYILGNALSSSRQSIGYAAWDTKMNTRVLIEEFYPQAIVSRGADGCVNPRKNKEQFARARALFLDAPLEGTRPIKCSHSFDTLNTAMRAYPLDEHHDALTRMEELLDAPIFFRDSAGNPVMTINALLIPSLPKAREYKPSSSLGKRKKKRTLIIALISLVALVIIGVSVWAAYTLNYENAVVLSLNAKYSQDQTWSLLRQADQVKIPISSKQVQDMQADAVVHIGLRRGDYALDITQEGRSIASTAFTVDRSDPSPIILLTHSPVPTAIPTPSPSPVPSPTHSPEPSQTPVITPAPSPQPTIVPPLPPPSMLVYKDSQGNAFSVQGGKQKPAQEYMLARVRLYEVDIAVNVEPALFDGLYLKHQETGNELEILPAKKENTLYLPSGTYQLYMKVKGGTFSPVNGSGQFTVASGMEEPLAVQYTFDEAELTLYADYKVQVFRQRDFVYAVDKTVYKETAPYKDYDIGTNDDGVRIAMKNEENLTEYRTLVPVQFKLGVPQEIYGALFSQDEFIIRHDKDGETINLTLEDLRNNLSMLPGEYTIEKREKKDRTAELWDDAKVTFAVDTPDNSVIDLDVSYQDVLRLTGTFVIKQDDKAGIYPETSALNDDQIKDLLSQALIGLPLRELSLPWPEDLDKEMENEYISVYVNENKIGKTKSILLSDGAYELSIRDESGEAEGGPAVEVRSEVLTVPSAAENDRFVIDETKLRSMLEKMIINTAKPEWMFKLYGQYYIVISDTKAVGLEGTIVPVDPDTFRKHYTRMEMQGKDNQLVVTVWISDSAWEQLPEDTKLRIIPFKRPVGGEGKITPRSGIIPIEGQFKDPSEPSLPLPDVSSGSASSAAGDPAEGDASPSADKLSFEPWNHSIAIFTANDIDALDLAFIDRNKTKGIGSTITFAKEKSDIIVYAVDLRKAVEEAVPGLPEDQEYSLKDNGGQLMYPLQNWQIKQDAISNYALLLEGEYSIEYIPQGSEETLSVKVTVADGAMTLSPK